MFLSLFRVSGHSMEPTFKPGQTLFVTTIPYLFRKPKIGDAVVFKDPRDNKPLLKRIVKIEHDKYYVVGDNPTASTDSRAFGTVLRKNILGKVVASLLD